MQTETPLSIRSLRDRAKGKAVYWLAAGAQTIAAALDLRDNDELKTAGQFSLALALVLLASSGAEPSRWRRFVTYLAIIAALGFLLARIVERTPKG